MSRPIARFVTHGGSKDCKVSVYSRVMSRQQEDLIGRSKHLSSDVGVLINRRLSASRHVPGIGSQAEVRGCPISKRPALMHFVRWSPT
jgi:hypothetical protein